MATSVFIDKEDIPNDDKLASVLGKTISVYNGIIEFLKNEYEDIKPEWKHYGKNSGWILKVFLKKRNLFFLFPCDGYFKISFVFGTKAIAEIEKSSLPETLKTELRNARQYAEGKGIQLTVKKQTDLKLIKNLLKIKIEN